MTGPAELQESVDAFRRELHRTSMTTSRIAELAHLKVLITRYPDQARQMVADLDVTRGPAGAPDPAPAGERSPAEPDASPEPYEPPAEPPGIRTRAADPIRA